MLDPSPDSCPARPRAWPIGSTRWPAGPARPRVRRSDRFAAASDSGLCIVGSVARSAEESFEHPAVVVINPDDDVTPAALFAWLDEVDEGEEPLDLPVSAAETLAEARAAGEV
jgi:hypothetical protein